MADKPKTLARLEREYQQYLERSRKEAERIRRKRPPRVKLSFLVQSRVVFDRDGFGHRFPGGTIRWGKWITWNTYRDNVLNLKKAINEVLHRLKEKHQGAIIYIRPVMNNLPSKKVVPIFQAKWGHDNLPFISWKDNPVALMWRRRIKG